MVWQKKPAAPAYVNLAEATEALLTGTPDAWMLPWWNLVDNRSVDVDAFCRAGPETCPPFDVQDFTGLLPGVGRIGGAAIGLGLAPKFACFARNRLFGSYCENTGASTDVVCADVATFEMDSQGSGAVSGPQPHFDIPAGTTRIAFTWVSGSRFDDYGMSIDVRNGNDNTHIFNAGLHPGVRAEWDWTYSTNPSIQLNFAYVAWNAQNTFRLEACRPGSGGAFIPPAVSEPPSAIAPAVNVYTTVADLGAELDAQEQKLDWLLAAAVDRQITDIGALVASGVPIPMDNGLQVVLTSDEIGVAVTISQLPADVDERFGPPVRMYKLGRVYFGNAFGWLPPVDLAVSPLLCYPLPAGIDRVRVHVGPPSIATVQVLKLGQPAG